jgi:hypothetical protein
MESNLIHQFVYDQNENFWVYAVCLALDHKVLLLRHRPETRSLDHWCSELSMKCCGLGPEEWTHHGT